MDHQDEPLPPPDEHADGWSQSYLSIPQAARMLAVAQRSIYAYLASGKLTRVIVEGRLMVRAEDIATFRRTPSGRARTFPLCWRGTPPGNAQTITITTVPLRAGQQHTFQQRLRELRSSSHLLPGTVARYIAQDRDQPEIIRIILVWSEWNAPAEDQRLAALAAFRAALADVVAWEAASTTEGIGLLHASSGAHPRKAPGRSSDEEAPEVSEPVHALADALAPDEHPDAGRDAHPRRTTRKKQRARTAQRFDIHHHERDPL